MNVYDEIITATNSVANSTLKPRIRVVSVAAPPERQNICTLILGGAGGLAVRHWTCYHLGHGIESHRGHLRNNLGQVVHTYVNLSPSSITWYRSKVDCLSVYRDQLRA